MNPNPFIHTRALVDPGVTIGAGTRIWAFAHIVQGAVIGRDCKICSRTVLSLPVGAHFREKHTRQAMDAVTEVVKA